MDDREHAAASGAGITAPAPARSRPPVSLRAPFDTYSPEELLEHFSTRTGVHFFAVPDESEMRRDKIDAVLENRFEFNHERHRLAATITWTTNPSRDVEWYYAVGLGVAYRDTGDRRYLDQWIALTDSWMAATPRGFIAADVTSRRVQNWIYAYRFFVADADVTAIPPDFHLRFLASLAEQVNFLCAHLTAARNHRTFELYSIFLAGVVFPELSNATGWRAFALPELSRTMATDLLPDGVHCELSTDVHHLVLKTYLCVRRLAAANRIAVPEGMDALLIKALEFSMHAHNPVGIVPSFSEGDSRGFLDLLRHGHELFGREDMLFVATQGRQGSRPSARSAAFPDSGYYVVRSGWGESHRAYADEHHLVFDCGPLGADNHGHFDCLSFELAAFGRPLVIDPGRYTDRGSHGTNWRARFRSTAHHNTVTVDGQNQTRYEPVPARESSSPGREGSQYEVTGPAPEHHLVERVCEEGFDLLHGRVRSHEYDALHERRIFFVGGRYWMIADSLVSRRKHLYEARFHLTEWAQGETRIVEAPGLRVVVSPHLLMVQPHQEAVILALEPGHVSYRYGKKLAAPVVCASTEAARATFVTLLLPYLEVPMLIPLIEPLPVTGSIGGPSGPPPRAFTISLGAEQDVLFFGTEREVEYRFDAYRFRGRYLVVRKNAAGAVTHVHTHPGAELTEAGHPVYPLRPGPPAR
jgi:Heparinase II/III-like protein/Heparinase II/III N-terminus